MPPLRGQRRAAPLHPEHGPHRYARYRVAHKQPWDTVALDLDAYRTRARALERACDMADDMIDEWEQKVNHPALHGPATLPVCGQAGRDDPAAAAQRNGIKARIVAAAANGMWRTWVRPPWAAPCGAAARKVLLLTRLP